MKKVILLSTLLASSALADESNFYLKANINASNFHKIENFTTQDKVKSLKQVPVYSLSVGGGYHLRDNVRTDLVYEGFKSTTHTGVTSRRDHKLRGKVDALTVNGYVDLVNVSPVSIFVGGGVGLSQVKATHLYTNKVFNAQNGTPYKEDPLKSKYKNNLNLAYTLHAGVGIKMTPSLTTEVFYSYKDLGKTVESTYGKLNTVSFKGHYTGIGLRLDI